MPHSDWLKEQFRKASEDMKRIPDWMIKGSGMPWLLTTPVQQKEE
jgi:hypothetical protein